MNATSSAIGSALEPESLQNDLTTSPASLSTDVLLKAMEEAKANEARLHKQIEEMQRRLARTQEEAKILTKLIALRSGKTPGEPANETIQVSPTAPPSAITVPKSGHNALEAVIAILEEANRPVHISDLMRLLGDKNVQIPGSGTQANLISHLRRDRRIVRPSRGMYGLAAWGLTEMASQAKRRRRRRRSR
jgi:hypothetical protein